MHVHTRAKGCGAAQAVKGTELDQDCLEEWKEDLVIAFVALVCMDTMMASVQADELYRLLSLLVQIGIAFKREVVDVIGEVFAAIAVAAHFIATVPVWASLDPLIDKRVGVVWGIERQRCYPVKAISKDADRADRNIGMVSGEVADRSLNVGDQRLTHFSKVDEKRHFGG